MLASLTHNGTRQHILHAALKRFAHSGYAAASVHPTLYANGSVAWIEELTVLESHRRLGIARLLVSSVEDWARSRGAVMMALATRRAEAFWSSVGCEASATCFRRVL